MLWHANGQARQNLLEGIPPGLSGHPYYNPHADDIDFQIECDFIGIISPGLSDSSQKISDFSIISSLVLILGNYFFGRRVLLLILY